MTRFFGIKAYRRRARKYRSKKVKIEYTNLLLSTMPLFRSHIWATDFTELWWRERKVYLATVIDFRSAGELIAEVYRHVWAYNHTRIHTALKMPPSVFAFRTEQQHGMQYKVGVQ